ncbi:MAG: beta-propeller fold lactonase family protein [Terracidiphilus sp.]
MKFNKSSQLLLVSAASLLAAGLTTACSTNTVDFVYVASSQAAGTNNYGEIDVFEINRVSGFMRQIPTSPFPSGGRDPVSEAVTGDYATLYVANKDDSNIVQFFIGPDGKIYPQNTYDTTGNYSATGTGSPTGIFPVAVAVNGPNLFVVNTYQPLPSCVPTDPCSGSLGVYPIQPATKGSNPTPSGALGSPVANLSNGANYWPLTLPGKPNDVIVPTAVNVLKSGAYVYVAAYDTTASPSVGYVFGFWVAPSGATTSPNGVTCPPLPAGLTAYPTGTLCSLTGSPFAAGAHPSAIASDSTSSYFYVTDSPNGKIFGYSVASGAPVALPGSPYPAGNQPSAIAVDPKYPFAYVANALDGNVSAYSIGSNGALSSVGTYAAGIDPVAIAVDPGTEHFVFTANFLANGASGTVSNFEMNTTAGTLVNTQHSPYTTNALPTAVAAVPHNVTP